MISSTVKRFASSFLFLNLAFSMVQGRKYGTGADHPFFTCLAFHSIFVNMKSSNLIEPP